MIDSAYYLAGRRVSSGENPDSFEWTGLVTPTADELANLARAHHIDPLAMAAIGRPHLRSRLDRYGDHLAMVVRAARYIEATETVEFGELHVYLSPRTVVTVRLAQEPDLAQARRTLEDHPPLLAQGPHAALWAILDAVVSTYEPVVDGLENDIDEIEDEIFANEPSAQVSRRIYELNREVIGFQRAVRPLITMVDQIRDSLLDDSAVDLRKRFREIQADLVRTNERIETFRVLLDGALATHAAIVSQRQTEVALGQTVQAKKISSWAAILYIPSMIGAIYGMNFTHMPELHWTLGYPAALLVMVGGSVALYIVFKRKDWI